MGMSTRARTVIALGVAVLALVSAAGFVTLAGWPPGGSSDSPNVNITLQLDRAEGRLAVSGTADLPDGTILLLSVTNLDPSAMDSVDGSATVISGHYGGTLDMAKLGDGELLATVSLVMSSPGQPQALLDRFGAHGERLRGPEVVRPWDGGDPFVQVSAFVLAE
jgi:hypothetical protein